MWRSNREFYSKTIPVMKVRQTKGISGFTKWIQHRVWTETVSLITFSSVFNTVDPEQDVTWLCRRLGREYLMMSEKTWEESKKPIHAGNGEENTDNADLLREIWTWNDYTLSQEITQMDGSYLTSFYFPVTVIWNTLCTKLTDVFFFPKAIRCFCAVPRLFDVFFLNI